jgi:hypothetical protein
MATRNIVPRADNEGSIGTASKRWSDMRAVLATVGTMTATTANITGGTATAYTITTATITNLVAGTIVAAGTTALASLKFTSGTLMTSVTAGAYEYDGTSHYATIDTSSGRAAICAEQFFRLTADGSTISTIANYFGATSNISLVSGAYYEIEIYCWFLNTTSGTVVWTFTNSVAPTSQSIHYRYSLVTGVNAGAGDAGYLEGDIIKDGTAAKALTATSALTTAVNQYAHFKIILFNSTGTSLKIQATKSAGTITPLATSYWKCRRLPASSTGTFSA